MMDSAPEMGCARCGVTAWIVVVGWLRRLRVGLFLDMCFKQFLDAVISPEPQACRASGRRLIPGQRHRGPLRQ